MMATRVAGAGVEPDTGVTLITDQAQTGVDSKDTAFGQQNCWG